MAASMEQTTALITQIQQSYDMQKLSIDEMNAQIKAYDAETKRLQAFANSMQPEQVQDIVMGTIAAAIDTGDLVAGNRPMEFEQ
jgi:methyl-accepting chemotaxis protein